MKFKFPFEKILAHKVTVENVARRNWAEAQSKVTDAQNYLRDMYKTADEVRRGGSERERQGGARGFEIARVDEFVNGHKILIERQRIKIRELMGEAERLQDLLLLAARDRKTFEKLREKSLEEFKLKKKKRELILTDELIVTRFKTHSNE